MIAEDRKRPAGRKILRVWLAGSAVYVAIIGLVSIGPVRAAVDMVRHPPPPPSQPAVVHTTGPIHTPESPTMRAAEVIGRQALIGLAPPLLVLWFGWDLWFAVSGLLQIRQARRANPPAEDRP